MRAPILLAAAATLALVGCKKADKADQAATAGDCKTVVTAALDRAMHEGMAAGGAPSGGETPKLAKDLAASLAPVVDATVRACTEDGWSAEALACMGSAQTGKAFDACQSKLSPAQKQHADKLIAEAQAKSAPAASPTCSKYADLEIKCGKGTENDRPTIVQFCEKARGGAPEVTYQLIALEASCADATTDCAAYHQCVEQKKRDTTPK